MEYKAKSWNIESPIANVRPESPSAFKFLRSTLKPRTKTHPPDHLPWWFPGSRLWNVAFSEKKHGRKRLIKVEKRLAAAQVIQARIDRSDNRRCSYASLIHTSDLCYQRQTNNTCHLIKLNLQQNTCRRSKSICPPCSFVRWWLLGQLDWHSLNSKHKPSSAGLWSSAQRHLQKCLNHNRKAVKTNTKRENEDFNPKHGPRLNLISKLYEPNIWPQDVRKASLRDPELNALPET